MKRLSPTLIAGLALGVMAAVLATGCSVQVNDRGEKKNVDVRTPLGEVKVRTEVDAADTGMRVYPGARPLRDGKDEPQSAHVNVASSLFGVQVVAAKFETDDAVDKVLEFYRAEMRPYGAVVECRGEIDFKGPRKSGAAVCKEGRGRDSEIKLGVGDEGQHRIVAIKPRGAATEFAMVYISTRGEQETL